MEIDKLLHVADSMSLKTFVWGQGVVDTLNHLLPPTQQITAEITGSQALALISALPPPAMAGIMSIQLSLTTGRPLGEPDPAPSGSKPAPAQTQDPAKRRSKLPIILASVIAFIAIMLTVVISATAIRSGTAPDEGAIRLILETLVNVIKLFMSTPPAAPPPVP